MSRQKALIAMSGGVDSSVAGHLLIDAGYEVGGISFKFIDLFKEEDAKKVADSLNIPFFLLDLREEFKNEVILPFIESYEMGNTPNPCILCNRRMKFSYLLDFANKNGYDKIATGHYARVNFDEASGRYILKKSKNLRKDQSYVLYNLTQEVLSRVIFPLEELSKDEVRTIADKISLDIANKPDSQDICFIPKGDYVEFIKEFKNTNFSPGNIIDTNGNVLGEHKGAISYTLGQRRGLGLSVGEPVFVCDKDMKANTVTVGKEENLFTEQVFVDRINYISVDSITDKMRLKAKLRYSQKEAEAVFIPMGEDRGKLVFDEPQRAPAPGQGAVFYDGDIVIGGGTITKGEGF